MDKYETIKQEVQTDPAGRGYAGQGASVIAGLMNEPIPQSPPKFEDVLITVQQIALLLIKRGKWKAVIDAAPTNSNAFALVELSKLASVADQVGVGELATVVTNLVTAGVLVVADAQALKRIAQREVKLARSDALGLYPVSQGDVEKALG